MSAETSGPLRRILGYATLLALGSVVGSVQRYGWGTYLAAAGIFYAALLIIELGVRLRAAVRVSEEPHSND